MVSISNSVTKVCATDLVAFLLIYLLPTLSHVMPFPMYLADPMRIAVLGTLLFTKNWKNTLAVAVTIPIFSFLVSAHPVFPKCLLISAELAANVMLFTVLTKKNMFLGTFASILISKLFYYVLKFAAISAGLLSLNLISTDILIQLLIAVLISGIFALTYKKQLFPEK